MTTETNSSQNPPVRRDAIRTVGIALGAVVIFAAGAVTTAMIAGKSVEVDAERIGESAGAAAADNSREAAKEVVRETVGDGPKSILDILRGGGGEDEESGGADREEKSERKPLSPTEIIRAMGDAKDEGLRQASAAAYEVSPISVEDEWAYGAQLGDTLRSQLAVSDDAEAIARIERLAAPILERIERTKGMTYRFTLVEEDVVNAFAILGGQVFIYRGLLDAMETDTAVQSVIAHEIAHVELEHCVKGTWVSIRAQDVPGGNIAAGVLAGAYNQLVRSGYSELQEYESDLFAYTTQREMGVAKQDRLRFVRVLQSMSEARGDDGKLDRPSETVPAAIGDELRRHYRTHPSGHARVERLERLD